MALSPLELGILEEIRSDVREIKTKQGEQAVVAAVLAQRSDQQDEKIEAQGKRIDGLQKLGGAVAAISAGLGSIATYVGLKP